jgi:excisionase family DNA binding protein
MSDDRLYTKDELAEWLGVPPSWVRDAITARSIPITWVGKHARFSPEDRAAIVAKGREAPARVRVFPGRRAGVVALAPRRRSA